MIIKNFLGFIAMAAIANSAVALDPQYIKFSNGIIFTPTLALSQYYDDNVRNAPGNRLSSWTTTIAPTFMLQVQERLNSYEAYYRFSHQRVSTHRSDDTTNHLVGARAHLEFDSFNKLNVYTSYQSREDRRDSTNNFFNESGNKYHGTSLGTDYTLGSTKAKFVFSGQYNTLRYDNNFSTGSRTREKERNRTYLGTVFYYNLLPKTDLLAEVNWYDYSYLSSASPLDSDTRVYRLGLTWQATAKTTGDIRFGRERKQFDVSSQQDVSQTSWDASVKWRFLPHSSLTFTSNRKISEGSFSEQYIKVTQSGIEWLHDWGKHLAYVNSSVGYSRGKSKYSGSLNNGRNDNTDDIEIKMNYAFRQWMDVSLNYRYINTDSNDAISDYDRKVIGLNIDMSL